MTTRLLFSLVAPPALFALFLMGACDGSIAIPRDDAFEDADAADAALGDASAEDASLDATVFDAESPDAAIEDAAVEDAAIEDAAVEDAAIEDAAVDASPPPCAFEGRTYRLRHLQASMEHFDPPAQIRAAIDAAFDAGAHTISWTEIENATAVNRIDRRSGWDTFWPSGSADPSRAKNAVPISWRRDTFRLIRGESTFSSAGRARVAPSRWVTRVWLRHVATGLTQSRLAHHSVSGVDGAGKPPVEWRRMTHALNIATFREVMLRGSVPVVGSADFNTTRLRTLLTGDFRFDVPSSGGSHGRRLIDWIVRRPHPELAFMNARFVGLGPSDHRGVRATYEYRPRCP